MMRVVLPMRTDGNDLFAHHNNIVRSVAEHIAAACLTDAGAHRATETIKAAGKIPCGLYRLSEPKG
jgi:hypothetical protein